MLFETWLQKVHGIDRKTFELRGTNVQMQMIEEYNNRKL